MRLADLTWQEIRDLPKEGAVVVLPIGSTEQHGPHLPCSTDTILAERVAHLAVERVGGYILPTLPYSKCNEHSAFPGTISLRRETLIGVVSDIVHSVHRSGFERLCLVNGHGGNNASLHSVLRDLYAELSLPLLLVEPGALFLPPTPYPSTEQRFGIHAGRWETSLMMAIAPTLVRSEKVVSEYPPMEQQHLHLFGGASIPWLSHDYSRSGVFGDATAGNLEEGKLGFEKQVERLAEILLEFSQFNPPYRK